jgi:hypothetical protein
VEDSKTKRIAALNDKFRRQILEPKFFLPEAVPGFVVRTCGFAALPGPAQLGILFQVRDYTAFTADNDPHGERDFGSLTLDGVGEVFWKIDYYADSQCLFGAEYPESLAQSYRVLTFMLASEY